MKILARLIVRFLNTPIHSIGYCFEVNGLLHRSEFPSSSHFLPVLRFSFLPYVRACSLLNTFHKVRH